MFNIDFEIWDRDLLKVKRDDFLGIASLPMSKIAHHRMYDQWLQLHPREGHHLERVGGTIHVKVMYTSLSELETQAARLTRRLKIAVTEKEALEDKIKEEGA